MMKKIQLFFLTSVLTSLLTLSLSYAQAPSAKATEQERKTRNRTCSLSTSRAGDKYVFDTGMAYIFGDHDLESDLAFIRDWNTPPNPGGNRYWRDVAYLYRLFAGFKARQLHSEKLLPDDMWDAMVPPEHASYDTFFMREATKTDQGRHPGFFYRGSITLGDSTKISSGVHKIEVFYDDKAIGFLIRGNDLKLDFLFAGQDRIDYTQLDKQFPNRTLIADFPLPMHTGGGKLIELAIDEGQIVNYIMSGGRRRSGVLVIDQEGRSFPLHIQRISYDYLGFDQTSREDLRYPESMNTFIQRAADNKWDVVQGMLLLDNLDGEAVRPISDNSEAGGRRMVVWKEQDDGNPALLVLNDGFFANHLTFSAKELGYGWGIYCDVNYYDNGGYWEDGKNRKRISHFDEVGKMPYHRMILYK